MGANSKTTQLISLQTQYLYHILVLYNVYIYINIQSTRVQSTRVNKGVVVVVVVASMRIR